MLVSPYYGLFYAVWVVLTRTAQVSLLAPYGHRYRLGHLPMLVFEQWWGSAIKIYCLFHPDRQVWQKSRKKAQILGPPPTPYAGLWSVVTGGLFFGSIAAYIVVVGLWVGAFAVSWR